jgi:1,4-alpha-glucan branching enzyme
MRGSIAIVLHAHLPWVRSPEHPRSLEERWFYEALWESYLPLVDVFDRLVNDGIVAPVTLSVSPPLAAMFADPLLRQRFVAHIDRLETLVELETVRTRLSPDVARVVAFYRQRLRQVRATWTRIGGDVLGALVRLERAGAIELLTTCVTHAYLPALTPTSVRAQIELGLRVFEAFSGHRPRGLWLPECGYDPSISKEIVRANVAYTVLDGHGVELAHPRPCAGIFEPILAPFGVAFFGREGQASRDVWSREVGYPGHPDYRDFYRDVGFDLDESQLAGEVGPNGTRLATGLKYHRVTGVGVDKLVWNPERGEARARLDAEHFVAERVRVLEARKDSRSVIVAPFDAELFGHWWFEGPTFLEHVLRTLDASKNKTNATNATGVVASTLGGYLAQHAELAVADPMASSWGEGGFGDAWLGRSLDAQADPGMSPAHLIRHLRHAERTVRRVVATHGQVADVAGQAIDQAIVELLLLESSDWGFMLRRGDMARYATARVQAHASRVERLCRLVERGWINAEDERWILHLREHNPFLAQLDGRRLRDVFAPAD